MLTLIIAGLDKMDVYHIALLLFFVVYSLYSDRMTHFPLYLLLYADFFVFEKYIYTLIIKNQVDIHWMEILGISTSYDPQKTQEYFRYSPRFD